MNIIESMAWSSDPLVREIFSQIGNRELDEIAESVYDLFFGEDGDDGFGEEETNRRFQEPEANTHLTYDEAVAATTLAGEIVDWSSCAVAYRKYDSPPWGHVETRLQH